MKLRNRLLALVLVAVLFATSGEFSVFAREGQTTPTEVLEEQNIEEPEEVEAQEIPEVMATKASTFGEDEEVVVLEDIWVDLGDTYTSVPWDDEDDMTSSSLETGVVELKNGNYEKWIDRLDLTGDAKVIRTFYDALVEASDNDGVEDQLIENQYFTLGGSTTETYISVAEIKGTVATEGEINTALNTEFARYSPYVRAAFDAFDRDHPEVFWLSGDISCGAGVGYRGSEQSGYTYTITIKFLLKDSDTDVRATAYNSESAIKTAIEKRSQKVQQLLQDTEGKSVTEKIDYFNDYLTMNNQYNTSANLNTIYHDARECVSALEGRIGTRGPVCEAYARAFKVLCDQAGIPCVLVDGDAKSLPSDKGEGHMWNYVQVDEKWYGMDVTWNDPSIKGSSTAVSNFERDDWSLVGSDTYPTGSSLKFIESHPVSNCASEGGLHFTNGPQLEEEAYEAEAPKADLTNAKVNVTGNFVYDGTEKIPEISQIAVTLEGENVPQDAYEILKVENNVNAGTATVYIKAISKGYMGTCSGTFEIQKAAKPDNIQVTKGYYYAKKHQVSLDLSQYLPKLKENLTYGSVSYAQETTEELFETAPVVNGNILSYVVKEGIPGATGTITVTVTTDNYEPFCIILRLELNDKTSTEHSQVSLKDNTITYGEKLSKLTFEEAVFVEEGTNNIVEGTLSWKNPDQILEAGVHMVDWIFTPANSEYASCEGTVEITVAKAECKIEQIPESYKTVYTYSGTAIPAPKQEYFTYTNMDLETNLTFSWYQGEYLDQRVLDNNHKLSEEPTDAGTYTLVVTLEETANYQMAELRTKVEIKKKPITVTLEDKTRSYGEQDPEFTFTMEEGTLAGQDTKEDLGIFITTTSTSDSDTGEYPITGSYESKNYEITIVPGTLTITKAQGMLRIPEGKAHYEKKYADQAFEIVVESNEKDALVYTVTEGKSLSGEQKNEKEILVVNENGIASIVGTGTVTVKISQPETKNHTVAEPVTVTIRVNSIKGFVVESIEDYTYTGKAICPEPKVYDGENERILEKGKDYTISYKNNINTSVNTTQEEKLPMVIVKGKGNYTKQIEVSFTILPKNIEDEDVTAEDIYLVTNGRVQKKAPTVSYNKKKLKSGKDIIITYPETLEGAYKVAGKYIIQVKGEGNFTGKRDVKLTLKEKGYLINKVSVKKIPTQSISDDTEAVILNAENLVVTTTISGKKITLTEGTDFETDYENHDKAGTATVILRGINDYSGIKKVNFKIKGISIANAVVSEVGTLVYNGEQAKPEVEVTLSGKKLDPETDYSVTYKKNNKVGTATLTIKGQGAYTGSISKKFTIEAYDISSETNADGVVKKDSLFKEEGGLLGMADGELAVKFKKGGNNPVVTLSMNGITLVKGKDYTVTYKNNKNAYELKKGDLEYDSAQAPAIIIKGKGNFKGTITKLFVIQAKSLNDGVKAEINDKVVSEKDGAYISKLVLWDEDGKKLVVGKDYTEPVYTVDGRILDKKETVNAGKEVTVTVSGLKNYTNEKLEMVYRITEKDFTKIKVGTITKEYNGSRVELTKNDFYDANGKGIITLADGTVLEYGEDKDFVIVEGSYKKNEKKGTATVTLKGCGEYGGVKTIKFKITSKKLKK